MKYRFFTNRTIRKWRSKFKPGDMVAVFLSPRGEDYGKNWTVYPLYCGGISVAGGSVNFTPANFGNRDKRVAEGQIVMLVEKVGLWGWHILVDETICYAPVENLYPLKCRLPDEGES